jgi:transposase-like protein
VRALGADTGISTSEVSRICADLDAEVGAFGDRSLTEPAVRSVVLDATYGTAWVDRRVLSPAVVLATGVAADGHREVLGCAVGDSEDGAFWTAFLRSLKARGPAGTQLVISDAHTGLKAAIQAVFVGAAWQRCRVHCSALRARPRSAGQRRDGRRRHPHRRRPARRRPRARPARRHRRDAGPPVSTGATTADVG